MNKIVGRYVLLYYPNSSKYFIIHTNARKLQLGGVLSQNGKPVYFYSVRLNPAPLHYKTIERELLIIFKSLKSIWAILLEHHITVYTDPKTFTHENFITERVFFWRFLLE